MPVGRSAIYNDNDREFEPHNECDAASLEKAFCSNFAGLFAVFHYTDSADCYEAGLHTSFSCIAAKVFPITGGKNV